MVTGAGPGCGPSRITASRIESAVAQTFANLVHVQGERMDLPPVDASSLHPSATCHKVGAGRDGDGGGNWVCSITWLAPGRRTPLRETYDLSVTMDGCYTATADAAETHVGGPTLTTQHGTTIVNPLYAFDGCFDTS